MGKPDRALSTISDRRSNQQQARAGSFLMSSPSSAKINASTNRITRNTKRDIGGSRANFGASAVSNSSRKVAGTGGGGGGGSSHAPRVYLEGTDVTPQSLLVSRIKPSTVNTAEARGAGGKNRKPGGRPSRSKNNNYSTTLGNSVAGASMILSNNNSTSSIDNDSDSEAPTSARVKEPAASSKKAVGSAAAPAVPVPLPSTSSAATATSNGDAGDEEKDDNQEDVIAAESDMNETKKSARGNQTAELARPIKVRRHPVVIRFAETPTMMLFESRSVCISQDASYHQSAATRNKAYLEMCAQKKGSDKYVEGRSQTLQLAQKTKEVMTAPPATRDAVCVATDWDIFDCMKIEEEANNEHDDSNPMDTATAKSKPGSGDGENGDVQLKHQVVEIVDATMASPGCVLDVDGDIVADLRARQHALRAKKGHKTHHGTTSLNSNNSVKSRVLHGNASQADMSGRSTMHVLREANSSTSAASPSQSSANLSYGASQDMVGGVDDSGGNASQMGMSSASHGVLSGNESDGEKDGKQNAYSRANTNVDIGDIIARQRTSKVLASESLLKTVSIIERAVQQNVYHNQHVLYRNFPSLHSGSDSSASGLNSHKGDGQQSENGWSSSPGAMDSNSPNSVPTIADFGQNGARTANKNGGLEKLWAFQCEHTVNRHVSCLAWNSANDDLLAVSYSSARKLSENGPVVSSGSASPTAIANNNSVGNANSASLPTATANGAQVSPIQAATDSSIIENDGLVLFWSLKNPEYPERIYNLPVGVTSVDFSRMHPYLLAVGFVNGVVAIYDTRRDDACTAQEEGTEPQAAVDGRPATASNACIRHVPAPVATSEISNGKHLDAVWQVKWINKGSDRAENVVSISSDGRVTEWSMKKGLSFSDLMTLKRVTNPLLGSDSRVDGVISRQASGHCLDFATNDPSVYYVGTEDGMIHKCSVSYNEQYLQTYCGHTGPVYQLLVSPFCSDIFLSCSGDWNIKLWSQSESKEVLNFRSVDLAHAVHGISWCPSDSTTFGSVAEDGRIEIWDLQQSILDPIITHFPKKYASAYTPAPGEEWGALGRASSAAAITGLSGDNNFDDLDDPPAIPIVLNDASTVPLETTVPQEIPLECTAISFAPAAPVILVGDSTGDVTVYRVPALANRNSHNLSMEDQIAAMHKAMNPNNHE